MRKCTPFQEEIAMKIKIKNKDVELKFNIGFIRRLDTIHNVHIEAFGLDMQFGIGLITASVQLAQYSPPMLSDVIQAAAACTSLEADKAVEDYAEQHGSLDELFKEVLDELKKSPVVKTTLAKLTGKPEQI